ncbi:hypothetical protein Tco_1315076 [Tanacetum coccineum]
MNTTQAQQKALDDAFVTPVDRLEFGKWNMRLKTDIKTKEATFKVVMDALALTPFYQAFLITAEVPTIYMQEFWATVTVYKSSTDSRLTRRNFLSMLKYLEKSYIFAPRFQDNESPNEKYIRKKAESGTSPKKKTAPASKGSKLKSSEKVAKTDKKKQPATMPKTKGLVVLSEVALTEAEQIKLATKRSKTQFHSSHASGSGVSIRPEVPGVPKYDLESDEESWTFSQDEEDADEETYVNDDSDEIKSDNDRDDLTYPNLSTYKVDDEEEEQEKADDEEMSFDQRVSTPPEYELTEEEEEENKEGGDKDKEGEQKRKICTDM